jgi:tRNA threonylcarbamoyl adenosine modification protein (Sua5/YciO/YrdC/YwlC family)
MNADAVAALRQGEAIVVPTDTVYGLVASALTPDPSLRLYALKGRSPSQPSALMAPSMDVLYELVPELRGRAGAIAEALLPGAYTLVLPNPARRFRWLTGSTQEAIGVRVPELPDPTRSILEEVTAFVSTSANLAGGPDAVTVDDLEPELRDAVALVVDGGRLSGTPSTVLDFTGDEPRVIREGAAPADEALARARAATA